MTLGLKKFDRYIVPSVVALDLAAGVGLVWLVRWTGRYLRDKWRTGLGVTILLGLIAFQAVLAWQAFPYFFSYYDPLLGGNRRAIKVMQIGWGEGLDQAARYINQKPNSEDLRVIAWYAGGSFSYFLKAGLAPSSTASPGRPAIGSCSIKQIMWLYTFTNGNVISRPNYWII